MKALILKFIILIPGTFYLTGLIQDSRKENSNNAIVKSLENQTKILGNVQKSLEIQTKILEKIEAKEK